MEFISFNPVIKLCLQGMNFEEKEISVKLLIAEPKENFENHPNVTDKKFPGNPRQSYRSQVPLKMTREITRL
ncbi:NAD(+)--rifampin ADP-ribosyltransferase [Chryseobacterium sp. CBTAP 102]|uniref:NAD(+)--rifampin ADP-ribosyltransferase n=1 Tax=Chryseobacterium sp. CBTAP 102 TaxID=2135644 RepID=UPI000D769C24|nr:NAD(+)--rifampin ADP-ribosyltransferase [Chryseobacterium sp. CBTAP 102]